MGVAVDVRLIYNDRINADEGRVEVFYDGEWGTICDDQWDEVDAAVVCRSLGYTHGLAHSNNMYGPGSGRIWLDEVRCIGIEDGVDECLHDPWGETDCSHSEDAGVECSTYMIPWWRHDMKAIFALLSPLWGESTGYR